MKISSKVQTLLLYCSRSISTKTQNPVLRTLRNPNFRYSSSSRCLFSQTIACTCTGPLSSFASSFVSLRYYNTGCAEDDPEIIVQMQDETDEDVDVWEEEDEAEPEIGDGGPGGGVVLQNCPWGERSLLIAQQVLLEFGDDMKIFAFKTTPREYIYVRLDSLSNKYGCPSMVDIENYSHQYKKRLDKAGEDGEIPCDLALEVSSPGANRLLRIPDDLERFKNMPMIVSYVEGDDSGSPEKTGVFLVDSIESEGSCIWRLADVKENRDSSAKGRPLSRKQRDWRLKLTYAMLRRVSLHVSY